MKKNYPKYFPILSGIFLIMFASCKKENNTPVVPDPVNYAKLGLYEQMGTDNVRRVYIAVSQIGTQSFSTAYGLIFDTGSTGMTIDANGILPASMITANGLVITGDSVNVNGITVKNQQSVLTYGGVDGSLQEYGYLAYAPVTIGDANGSTVTPRIPIFLYYKIVNTTTGKAFAAHSADVFGVASGYSSSSKTIASPLSYFKLGTNVTSGFRLGLLPSAAFTTTTATYAPSLLYIGLTPNDLGASKFIMHPLTFNSFTGYSPNIASTITYNGTSIPGTVLFDTGTPTTSIIANSGATSNVSLLPANTSVTIATGQGFNYQYTTTSNFNITEVENPTYSHDNRTIFSIDFFLSNEYLIDYTNNRIGLKNN